VENKIFYTPEKLYIEENGGLCLVIDPESPNWVSTNPAGAYILRHLDGRTTMGEVCNKIASEWNIGYSDVFHGCMDFIRDGMAKSMIYEKPCLKPAYTGRADAIAPGRLEEIWIYTNQNCNLSCRHCLVSAGPHAAEDALSLNDINGIIDEAVELGCQRVYLTGGEPFLRKDIYDILDYVSSKAETIILTNGTILDFSKLESFADRDVRFQISLEGPNAEINDRIRGRGNFELALRGIKGFLDIGINPIITTTVTKLNQDAIVDTTIFMDSMGILNHHILWLHARGRTKDNMDDILVSSEKLRDIMRELREVTKSMKIIVDNEESLKVRVKVKRGRKNDLCNCCYSMFSIGADGNVYPCAALTGDRRFACGSIKTVARRVPSERGHPTKQGQGARIKDIWLNSRVMQEIRALTVQKRVECNNCYLKFICGGGCFCQGYYDLELRTGAGCTMATDPYCEAYKALFTDILWESARKGINGNISENGRYQPPQIFNAMSGTLPSCASSDVSVRDASVEVGGFHCSCVLAVDVEKPEGRSSSPFASCSPVEETQNHAPAKRGAPASSKQGSKFKTLPPLSGVPPKALSRGQNSVHESVKDFYGDAAKKPKQELCCPILYNADDISHTPQDAIEISYGCGIPVSLADVKEGEVLLDLGSGGGIDCFIAAKFVGKSGRVIGIDMTDEMLDKAKTISKTVAENLGYDVVEFKKGFLEDMPVPENTADIITSNCVINLSPDKKRVFKEIYRVLKDSGRFYISDIVSDKDVPCEMQSDKKLWGECISGALREERFITIAKETGFYGLEIIKRYLYKEVDGIKFYSITVRGYKPQQVIF